MITDNDNKIIPSILNALSASRLIKNFKKLYGNRIAYYCTEIEIFHKIKKYFIKNSGWYCNTIYCVLKLPTSVHIHWVSNNNRNVKQ